MQDTKVGIIQITSNSDIQNNIIKLKEFSEQAVEKGARFLTYPENFSFFGTDKEKMDRLEEIYSYTQEFLVSTARELSVPILGGGYPAPLLGKPEREESGGSSSSDSASKSNRTKCFNQASWVDADGNFLTHYRKMHLFDTVPGDGVSYLESRYVEAGDELPSVVRLPGIGSVASFICYDIRFPEVFRSLSLAGVEILCLPAAFTVPTGEAHWEVLLRARAIENFCYMVAPAQTGIHDPQGKRRTFGNSMVIDPWGRVLGRMDTEEGAMVVDLSSQTLEESRKKIPSLEHRRFGIFKS